MNLRNELQPDIKEAERRFPIIKQLLEKFDIAFDDFDEEEMDTIIDQINQLTLKQIDKEDIYEYWGYTSQEDLAFSLALPDPQKIDTITQEEKTEIKQYIDTLYEFDEDQQKNISEFLFLNNVNVAMGLIDNYYTPLLNLYDTKNDNIIYL